MIRDRANRAHVHHVQGGFLRSTVVYLRTAVPTVDSSLFIVILRIQLELICWVTTPPVIITLLTLLYLYTQPIKESTVVFPTRFCHIQPLLIGRSTIKLIKIFFYL